MFISGISCGVCYISLYFDHQVLEARFGELLDPVKLSFCTVRCSLLPNKQKELLFDK